MKKIIILVLLLLSSCSEVRKLIPQDPPKPPPIQQCRWKDGLDILGKNSRNWNCGAMVEALKTLPCSIPLGYFGGDTFGPPNDTCIQQAIDTKKVWGLRNHFAWSNHQPRTAQQLAPAATAFNALCSANPQIECYPSAVCEDYMTAQQKAQLHSQLRPLLTAPNMKQWVDSGLREKDPAAIPEVHSNKSKSAIVSQDGGTNGDGNGMLDVDVEQVRPNGSLMTFFWDTSMNCKFSNKDKRPANQRDDCPTADEFMHFVSILSPRPAFPAIPGVVKPSGNQIYKPSSDNHGGCRDKDCKALWITNPFPGRQPDKLSYYTTNGVKLGEMSCYRCGDRKNWLNGKYPRFYASETAHSIFTKTKKQGDSEFIIIDEKRAKIIVHPLHRGGVLR